MNQFFYYLKQLILLILATDDKPVRSVLLHGAADQVRKAAPQVPRPGQEEAAGAGAIRKVPARHPHSPGLLRFEQPQVVRHCSRDKVRACQKFA